MIGCATRFVVASASGVREEELAARVFAPRVKAAIVAAGCKGSNPKQWLVVQL